MLDAFYVNHALFERDIGYRFAVDRNETRHGDAGHFHMEIEGNLPVLADAYRKSQLNVHALDGNSAEQI